ncbi:complex I assembly factor ACAD9, mitochondrial-like [Lycorma delicatula]|uniref:complex I assembly factor ACAD9, mitochondrial-like n=1 Tax=Lycorma delicatula TaxID=130591 RepID=UPI003F516256
MISLLDSHIFGVLELRLILRLISYIICLFLSVIMNLPKTISVLRRLNLTNFRRDTCIIQSSEFERNASSNRSSVEEVEPQESSISEEKKVMKGPFIKNLFLGIFNTDFLEYPEYSSMEFIKEVQNIVLPPEEYVLTNVDSKMIDEQKEIPQDVINALKDYKFYGLQVPRKYGGLELDDKCSTRCWEAVGSDFSISTSLAAHNMSLNAILSHGSEEQKEFFLRKMASGEITVSCCFVEKPSVIDMSDINTTALPNENGDWELNGKKIWVTNGNKVDYYLVFATSMKDQEKSTNNHLTAFVVDKNSPGLECGPAIEQLGTRGVSICDVTFNKVIVPKSNILGEVGNGVNIAVECLSRSRLGAAASSVGFLKNLLNMVTEFVIYNKINNKALYTYEYFKRQVGKIAVDLYALESMVYLTAGIKDAYDNAELSLEESVVKIYSMEKVAELVDLCAYLVGGKAYVKDSPLERCIRDSRSFLLHDIVPINVTKLYIATLGLQHAGAEKATLIKKARNPYDFPGFALRNFFKDTIKMSRNDDYVKEGKLLRLQLHPSLSGDADKLESCAVRFEGIVRELLQRWGIEIIDKQVDLIRLADCVVSMYGMTAVLGRASRAYCLGLHNSHNELYAVNAFCNVNFNKVKNTINDLYSSPMETNDSAFMNIGEQIALQKGYFFSHPLARNY